jgi:hypothetical protein
MTIIIIQLAYKNTFISLAVKLMLVLIIGYALIFSDASNSPKNKEKYLY